MSKQHPSKKIRIKSYKKESGTEVKTHLRPDIGEPGRGERRIALDNEISKGLKEAQYKIVEGGEVIGKITRHRALQEAVKELVRMHPEMKQTQPKGWTKKDVAWNLLWHHLNGLANLREGAAQFAREKAGTEAAHTERLRARNRKLLIEDRDWVAKQSKYAKKPREWMTMSPSTRAKKMPGGKK